MHFLFSRKWLLTQTDRKITKTPSLKTDFDGFQFWGFMDVAIQTDISVMFNMTLKQPETSAQIMETLRSREQ